MGLTVVDGYVVNNVLAEADHTTLPAFDAQTNDLRDLDGKGILNPCIDKRIRHDPINRAWTEDVRLRITYTPSKRISDQTSFLCMFPNIKSDNVIYPTFSFPFPFQQNLSTI